MGIFGNERKVIPDELMREGASVGDGCDENQKKRESIVVIEKGSFFHGQHQFKAS